MSRCCAPVEALKRLKTENEDQKHGIDIVRKAIQTPARQIAINAGDDGSVVVGKIMDKDQYSYGYDAQTGEYGNLVTKGIIDPTKVVRCALQDAASIAGLLITTEAMVAEVPKKETRSGDAGRRHGRDGLLIHQPIDATNEARGNPGPFIFLSLVTPARGFAAPSRPGQIRVIHMSSARSAPHSRRRGGARRSAMLS